MYKTYSIKNKEFNAITPVRNWNYTTESRMRNLVMGAW